MIRVIRADVADRPLDGSVFGYLGFRFLDEQAAGGFRSMTGLLLMPADLPDSTIKGPIIRWRLSPSAIWPAFEIDH